MRHASAGFRACVTPSWGLLSSPCWPAPPCRRIYGCVPLRGDPWVDVGEGEYGVAQCPKGLVISRLANITYGTADGRVSPDSEM